MRFLWDFCGNALGLLWNFSENDIGLLCKCCGIAVGLLWHCCGIALGLLITVHSIEGVSDMCSDVFSLYLGSYSGVTCDLFLNVSFYCCLAGW